MQTNNNIPQLRFPEFKEEWKEKRLSELLSLKNGLNASKENYGSGYKFINVLDIINNDFITHDKIIGSVNVSEAEFKKNIVEYGDILFQRSSETREEVGQANVYLDKDIPATFGGFVIRGKKEKDYNPIFLNYLLKTASARKEITSKSGGSTRYNVGQETLSSVTITVTEINEQTKIANFLTAVDKRITLLQQKKTELEQYKKGIMQKLFSQEIRFKDDNGNDFPDWEKKKLGCICEITKGTQLNKAELEETGTYPAINGGIEPSGYTENWNTKENTITISEGGNSCGYINYIKTKFWSGGHCYSLLNVKNVINETFLFQSLKFNQNQIMRLRVGSGLPNIQKGDITNFKIHLPNKQEQQKIANFLSSIDKKIEKLTSQIEQNQQFRQGLLQKMFV